MPASIILTVTAALEAIKCQNNSLHCVSNNVTVWDVSDLHVICSVFKFFWPASGRSRRRNTEEAVRMVQPEASIINTNSCVVGYVPREFGAIHTSGMYPIKSPQHLVCICCRLSRSLFPLFWTLLSHFCFPRLFSRSPNRRWRGVNRSVGVYFTAIKASRKRTLLNCLGAQKRVAG